MGELVDTVGRVTLPVALISAFMVVFQWWTRRKEIAAKARQVEAKANFLNDQLVRVGADALVGQMHEIERLLREERERTTVLEARVNELSRELDEERRLRRQLEVRLMSYEGDGR